MTTLFSRIIDGDLPGRFVWRDETCVAFLTIAPLRPGHVLVVPRTEVASWVDLDPATWAHVSEVTRHVGVAVQHAWEPPKVGVVLAGFEVDHVHVHVFPAYELADFDFARADADATPADLDAAAERIRGALRTAGRPEVVDA